MKTYGRICQMCRKDYEKKKLTIDHIVPRFAGGSNHITNKQLLCRECHDMKTIKDKVKYAL